MRVVADECLVVICRRGWGKTTFLKTLHRQIADPPLTIIFDPMKEYGDSTAPDRTLCVGSPDSFRDAAAIDFLKQGNTLIYRPDPGRDEIDDMLWLMALVWQMRNTLLIVDELTTLLNRVNGPLIYEPMHLLITRGRHKGLAVWGAAHRPVGIDKLFISQCAVFTGPTSVKSDRDILRGATGDELPFDTMKKYDFLALSDGRFHGKYRAEKDYSKISLVSS